MTFKKILLRNHRLRIRMTHNRTPVATLHGGGICHVIPMSMRQNQQIHPVSGKVFVRSVRRIKQDVPLRRLNKKTICGIRATGKIFELKHG